MIYFIPTVFMNPQFIRVLPFKSQQIFDDPEMEISGPVGVWRSEANICEHKDFSRCDDTEGMYYSYADDAAAWLCPRHWYETHFATDRASQLIDMTHAEYAKEATLAQDRQIAKRKDQFGRYFEMSLEQKIGLAMDILWDVNDEWDNETLLHYPSKWPSFDEWLAEIGEDLYAIEWKKDPSNRAEG